MNRFFISIFAICFLISGIYIVGGENSVHFSEEIQLPNFTRDDCECPGINMNLTLPSYQSRMFGADFHDKGTDLWLRHEVWYYGDAETVQQKFSRNLDATLEIMNIGWAREHIKQYISEGKDYTIIEEDINETRASFIWKDDYSRYQGKRTYILKDAYIGTMNAEDFESENEILHAMNTLEDCIKAVVDSKGSKVEEETQEETISGSLTIYDHPLKFMYITLEYDGETYETITDDGGQFNFTVEKKDTTEYELICHLKYIRDTSSFFTIHYQDQEEYIKISFIIKNSEIVSTVIDLGKEGGVHSLDTDSLHIENIKWDDISSEYVDFYDFGSIYLHSSEVIEFYKDHLSENIELETPVTIFTRLDEGIRYDYKDGKSWIVIDPEKTYHQTEYKPKCREYHELSHHAMRALYGGEFPTSSPSLGKDINHAGYNNPSTADSYVEGFAVFMSAIIAEYYENWWTEDKNPSNIPPGGNLEVNIEAWERGGKIEDLAAAGVLWDLYDGEGQVTKAEKARENKLNKFRENLLKGFDINQDNFATKKECIAVVLYGGSNAIFDSNPNERSLDNAEIALLISKFIIPSNIEATYTKEQRDHFKEDMRISYYDNDANGSLDQDEFISFFQNQIKNSIVLNDVFEYYDANKDKIISGDELESLAVGEYIRHDLIDKNDADRNDQLNLTELENISDWIEPHLRNAYPDISKYLDEIQDGVDINNDTKVFTGTIEYSDDDNVSISFKDMWKILREKHDDFTSVYSAFVSSFPDQKNAIDEIFKNHGFFADIGPENKKWDVGEEIGRAANGSSAARQARRSTELSPGQFIKVDNQIPFYNVTIVIFDGIAFLSDIRDIYTITVQNDEGLVYLPVPPERYNSWMYVEAIGVETKNPAYFSSTEFYNEYNETIDQGFFTEYSFETEGEIPVLEKSLTELDSETNSDSPAFEIIMCMFALLVIMLYGRKRQQPK